MHHGTNTKRQANANRCVVSLVIYSSCIDRRRRERDPRPTTNGDGASSLETPTDEGDMCEMAGRRRRRTRRGWPTTEWGSRPSPPTPSMVTDGHVDQDVVRWVRERNMKRQRERERERERKTHIALRLRRLIFSTPEKTGPCQPLKLGKTR